LVSQRVLQRSEPNMLALCGARREDTWQDEVRLKTSIIGLDQIDYAVQPISFR
jgi:hypothetical protein